MDDAPKPPDAALISRWVGAVQCVVPTSEGSTKRTFKVGCAGGASFLCKLSAWKADDLVTRYRILASVAERASVALALEREGQPFLKDGDRIWELFPWIEQHGGLDRRTQFHGAGAALGMFHAAVAGNRDYDRLTRRLSMPVTADAIRHELADARQALNVGGPPEADRAVHALNDLVEREAQALAELPRYVSELPQQWIHGDFHLANVVTTAALHTTLVDFDKFMRGWRIFDMAKFIMCDGFEDKDGSYLPDLVESLGAGYRRHVQLDDAELRALPILVLGCHVGAAWLVRQVCGAGRTDLAKLIPGYIKRMTVLFDEFPRIAASMLAAFAP